MIINKRGSLVMLCIKKFTALVIASGISLSVAAFAFAGCDLFTSKRRELYENALAEAKEYLTSVQEGGNFTFIKYGTSQVEYYFKFDGDLVEFVFLNNPLHYCYTENVVLYLMSQNENGNWVAEVFDEPSIVNIMRNFPTTIMETVSWSSYDEETGFLKGRQDGTPVEMKIENGEMNFRIQGDSDLYVCTDVGTTTVTLPAIDGID